MNQFKRASVMALLRRISWLQARALISSKDLSYDKKELSALLWAIEELEVIYPAIKEMNYDG